MKINRDLFCISLDLHYLCNQNESDMRLNNGFVLREVCGENVIVGEGLGAVNFGKLLALNETAAWLWKQAREMGEFTIDGLVQRLCEEYDVTPDEARNDVAAIIADWQSVDVIE